jgi:hypothetical protein
MRGTQAAICALIERCLSHQTRLFFFVFFLLSRSPGNATAPTPGLIAGRRRESRWMALEVQAPLRQACSAETASAPSALRGWPRGRCPAAFALVGGDSGCRIGACCHISKVQNGIALGIRVPEILLLPGPYHRRPAEGSRKYVGRYLLVSSSSGRYCITAIIRVHYQSGGYKIAALIPHTRVQITKIAVADCWDENPWGESHVTQASEADRFGFHGLDNKPA